MIKERAREFGEVVMLHEDEITFPKEYDVDVVIIRNVSHFKGMYLPKLFEDLGIPTVNSFNLMFEAGDKLLSTLRLQKKVPVPKWGAAVSENAAKKMTHELSFPLVSKPVFGSLVVNEVNPNMEFKNAQRVTGVDIAKKLVEYAVEVAKR
ncbi:hypothetical protein [Pyrococcus kukulkanii]|uniref:hypothetical protein n=1 Tax=Pyrococcus kukulkanii TaxID=1609559 RepID=UPI003562D631